MAAASGHILPLENSSIHQWCFTGTWTLPPPTPRAEFLLVGASGDDLIHTVIKGEPPPITLITSTAK